MLIQPLKKTTLAEAVMERLSKLITAGHYPAGSRLPTMRELAARFGVAQAPVREALRGLAMIGMIEIRAAEGSFVKEPSSFRPEHVRWVFHRERENIQQVYEARCLIETELIILAARKGTAKQKQAIRKLWEQMRHMARAGKQDPAAFVRVHSKFNDSVGEAAGNKVLTRLMQALRVLEEQAHLEILRLPEAMENAIQRDGKLVVAIESGSPQKARKAAKEHFRSVFRLLRVSEGKGGDHKDRKAGARRQHKGKVMAGRKVSGQVKAAP